MTVTHLVPHDTVLLLVTSYYIFRGTPTSYSLPRGVVAVGPSPTILLCTSGHLLLPVEGSSDGTPPHTYYL